MESRGDGGIDGGEIEELERALLAMAWRIQAPERSDPVTSARPPREVAARFDEPLPRAGSSTAEVLERLERDVLPDTLRLAHPGYLSHQVAPPLPGSAGADALVTAANQSLAVREMSPVATHVERRVVAWFLEQIGWSPDEAAGSFVSGGAIGNLTGLAAARARALPDAWTAGVSSARGRPRVVAGAHAHYSVQRALGVLGLGSDAAVLVPAVDGRLPAQGVGEALARIRADGELPVAVVACAGTTATGSVDDLAAIGAVARRAGVWLHVDAAHAGAFLISDRLRPMLAGLELADSVALDLHKMMFQPISSGLVLARDRRALDLAFAQEAPYLFHADDDATRFDQGPRTLQCSRRADALRVWIVLQLHGADAIAARQERCVELAAHAAALLDARDEFETCHRPQTNILCFRHVPVALAADPEALDAHNVALREEVNRGGELFVNGTLLDGRRVLRVTLINPRASRDDMAAWVEGVARAARAL